MSAQYYLGYPKNFGDPHFGLYNQVLDCFLTTVCDKSTAQDLQLLASSRYVLAIVDLVGAENYDLNLIDNHCCDNWTFSNHHSVDFCKPFVYQTHPNANQEAIVHANLLVPAMSDPRTGKEKDWLQMMLEWRSFAAWLIDWTWYLVRYKAVSQLVPMKSENAYETVLNFDVKTKQILYLERDQPRADAAIKELIYANDLLHTRYNKWNKDRGYCT